MKPRTAASRLRPWLTSVPGYASAIGYHPNGMVNTVSHASGVTYTRPRTRAAAAPGLLHGDQHRDRRFTQVIDTLAVHGATVP